MYPKADMFPIFSIRSYNSNSGNLMHISFSQIRFIPAVPNQLIFILLFSYILLIYIHLFCQLYILDGKANCVYMFYIIMLLQLAYAIEKCLHYLSSCF